MIYHLSFVDIFILVDFLPFSGIKGSKKGIHCWHLLETIILCMPLMEEHGFLEDESVVEMSHWTRLRLQVR